MFESIMSAYTGPVTLIITMVASATASALLTQQWLTRSSVLKKCDFATTGGLVRSGFLKWHWRQFKSTIQYQSIVFSLPAGLYRSLGLSSTVEVDSPHQNIVTKAIQTREYRETGQAGWVSLIQDFAYYSSLSDDILGVRDESVSHSPSDLSAALTRVDGLTVLLCSVAMGMNVYKYSPKTGQVVLIGDTGTIISSKKSETMRMLHYHHFPSPPSIGADKARLHGQALCHDKGVWANTVFGRFRDRSYRSDFNSFGVLSGRKYDVLESEGWPKDSYQDTIAGAACFLLFAFVDSYMTVPPSVVRPYCAHFAETILKIHHWDIIASIAAGERLGNLSRTISASFYHQRSAFIDHHGCSSPFLPWSSIPFPTSSSSPSSSSDPEDKSEPLIDLASSPSENHDYTTLLTPPTLLADLSPLITKHSTEKSGFISDSSDPSTYLSPQTGWEMVMRLDQCLWHIASKSESKSEGLSRRLMRTAEKIAARSLAPLAEIGAPSFKKMEYPVAFETWLGDFDEAVEEVLRRDSNNVASGTGESGRTQELERAQKISPEDKEERESWKEDARQYALLLLLRAAYYTVMMRAAHELGPGLKMRDRENHMVAKIETGEFYMA